MLDEGGLRRTNERRAGLELGRRWEWIGEVARWVGQAGSGSSGEVEGVESSLSSRLVAFLRFRFPHYLPFSSRPLILFYGSTTAGRRKENTDGPLIYTINTCNLASSSFAFSTLAFRSFLAHYHRRSFAFRSIDRFRGFSDLQRRCRDGSCRG